jgi:hypothetical protein
VSVGVACARALLSTLAAPSSRRNLDWRASPPSRALAFQVEATGLEAEEEFGVEAEDLDFFAGVSCGLVSIGLE